MTAVRGVIFDLDDTLFDCTGLLTEPARRRAAVLLAPHVPEDEDGLVASQASLSDDLGSSGAIRAIGDAHGVDPAVVESALLTYNRDDVPPIAPFPDAVKTLDALLERSLPLFLVTTGRRVRQLAKVERLGLDRYFQADRNVFVHEPSADRPEKDRELAAALEAGDLEPPATLSIGDKLDSDVRVGNRLGLVTVRLRAGRQKDLEPRSDDERPVYDIRALTELVSIVDILTS